MSVVPAPNTYAALNQTLPAVLKPMALEKVLPFQAKIKNMLCETKGMHQASVDKVISAQSSIFTQPVTHTSPIGPWIIAFGTLLGTTIYGWKEESFEHNLAQTVSLVAMATSAVQAGVIFWRNHKQRGLVDMRVQRAVHLDVIRKSLKFLNHSMQMATACLQKDPPADLGMMVPFFDKYMIGLPAGVVNNPLATAWSEVSQLVANGHEEVNLEQLDRLIQGKVLPLIKHYSKEVLSQLTELGYEPPQAARGVVVEMEEY